MFVIVASTQKQPVPVTDALVAQTEKKPDPIVDAPAVEKEKKPTPATNAAPTQAEKKYKSAEFLYRQLQQTTKLKDGSVHLSALKELAQAGDIAAKSYLAVIQLSVCDANTSHAAATIYKTLLENAKRGCPIGETYVGLCLAEGKSTSANPSLAIHLLLRGALRAQRTGKFHPCPDRVFHALSKLLQHKDDTTKILAVVALYTLHIHAGFPLPTLPTAMPPLWQTCGAAMRAFILQGAKESKARFSELAKENPWLMLVLPEFIRAYYHKQEPGSAEAKAIVSLLQELALQTGHPLAMHMLGQYTNDHPRFWCSLARAEGADYVFEYEQGSSLEVKNRTTDKYLQQAVDLQALGKTIEATNALHWATAAGFSHADWQAKRLREQIEGERKEHKAMVVSELNAGRTELAKSDMIDEHVRGPILSDIASLSPTYSVASREKKESVDAASILAQKIFARAEALAPHLKQGPDLFKHYEIAANAGNADAKRIVGDAYARGWHVSPAKSNPVAAYNAYIDAFNSASTQEQAQAALAALCILDCVIPDGAVAHVVAKGIALLHACETKPTFSKEFILHLVGHVLPLTRELYELLLQLRVGPETEKPNIYLAVAAAAYFQKNDEQTYCYYKAVLALPGTQQLPEDALSPLKDIARRHDADGSNARELLTAHYERRLATFKKKETADYSSEVYSPAYGVALAAGIEYLKAAKHAGLNRLAEAWYESNLDFRLLVAANEIAQKRHERALALYSPFFDISSQASSEQKLQACNGLIKLVEQGFIITEEDIQKLLNFMEMEIPSGEAVKPNASMLVEVFVSLLQLRRALYNSTKTWHEDTWELIARLAPFYVADKHQNLLEQDPLAHEQYRASRIKTAFETAFGKWYQTKQREDRQQSDMLADELIEFARSPKLSPRLRTQLHIYLGETLTASNGPERIDFRSQCKQGLRYFERIIIAEASGEKLAIHEQYDVICQLWKFYRFTEIDLLDSYGVYNYPLFIILALATGIATKVAQEKLVEEWKEFTKDLLSLKCNSQLFQICEELKAQFQSALTQVSHFKATKEEKASANSKSKISPGLTTEKTLDAAEKKDKDPVLTQEEYRRRRKIRATYSIQHLIRLVFEFAKTYKNQEIFKQLNAGIACFGIEPVDLTPAKDKTKEVKEASAPPAVSPEVKKSATPATATKVQRTLAALPPSKTTPIPAGRVDKQIKPLVSCNANELYKAYRAAEDVESQQQAYVYLVTRAHRGSSNAQYCLGLIAYEDKPPRYAEAYNYFQQVCASDLGNTQAMQMLARCCAEGHGTKPDVITAVYWWTQAYFVGLRRQGKAFNGNDIIEKMEALFAEVENPLNRVCLGFALYTIYNNSDHKTAPTGKLDIQAMAAVGSRLTSLERALNAEAKVTAERSESATMTTEFSAQDIARCFVFIRDYNRPSDAEFNLVRRILKSGSRVADYLIQHLAARINRGEAHATLAAELALKLALDGDHPRLLALLAQRQPHPKQTKYLAFLLQDASEHDQLVVKLCQAEIKYGDAEAKDFASVVLLTHPRFTKEKLAGVKDILQPHKLSLSWQYFHRATVFARKGEMALAIAWYARAGSSGIRLANFQAARLCEQLHCDVAALKFYEAAKITSVPPGESVTTEVVIQHYELQSISLSKIAKLKERGIGADKAETKIEVGRTKERSDVSAIGNGGHVAALLRPPYSVATEPLSLQLKLSDLRSGEKKAEETPEVKLAKALYEATLLHEQELIADNKSTEALFDDYKAAAAFYPLAKFKVAEYYALAGDVAKALATYVEIYNQATNPTDAQSALLGMTTLFGFEPDRVCALVYEGLELLLKAEVTIADTLVYRVFELLPEPASSTRALKDLLSRDNVERRFRILSSSYQMQLSAAHGEHRERGVLPRTLADMVQGLNRLRQLQDSGPLRFPIAEQIPQLISHFQKFLRSVQKAADHITLPEESKLMQSTLIAEEEVDAEPVEGLGGGMVRSTAFSFALSADGASDADRLASRGMHSGSQRQKPVVPEPRVPRGVIYISPNGAGMRG